MKSVEITVKMTMEVEDDYPMPEPDGGQYGCGWTTAYDNMRSLAELVADWRPFDCWILEGNPRRHAIGGGTRVTGEITAVEVDAGDYASWDIDFDEPVLGLAIRVVEGGYR
jgi:hypothetical protein